MLRVSAFTTFSANKALIKTLGWAGFDLYLKEISSITVAVASPPHVPSPLQVVRAGASVVALFLPKVVLW
jgi:hypothetical protein